MTKRKPIPYLVAIAILALALGVALEWREIRRIVFLESLFSGADQVENFRNMRSLFSTRTVARSPTPFHFASGSPMALPQAFSYEGRREDAEAFLTGTDTTGLLIVKNDKIVFERYWRGNDADSHWISWSLAKSFVATLVGFAVQEGAIASIEEPVSKYAPELRGTAYDGVAIKNVLQMSSGVQWDEDYGNRSSDVYRLGPTLALGLSLDAFAQTLKRQYPPGTYRTYDSMDAQVLGMVLRHTTGRSLSEYLADRLWVPLGMESDLYWIIDNGGVEWASAGMNATLRDYAKLGRLYLNHGQWNGAQILAADWVRQSLRPSSARALPRQRRTADSSWGYGYQWWIPDSSGDFAAVGVYNQFVFVSPEHCLIIAKTSASRAYGTTSDETSYREGEHIAFFKAIEATAASCGSDAAEPVERRPTLDSRSAPPC